MFVDMWSYLHNQRSKQKKVVDLQFLSNYVFFSKNWFRKLLKHKIRTSNMTVYFIIPLNYRLTGHPETFKVKLYYFKERLSLWYNIILKFLFLLHICIDWMMLPETTKSKCLDKMHYVCVISMVGSCHWKVFLENRYS